MSAELRPQDRELEALQAEALAAEVDLSLLRANLRLSPADRLRTHDRFVERLLSHRPAEVARRADERRAALDAR